jgi:general secretion pathway protein A
MYTQFYGLNRKPFDITPDPRFIYPSGKHKEAFSTMLYGVRKKKGLVVLTGEVGTGKTLLLRTLLKTLDSTTRSAFIFNPRLTTIDFFQAIAADFGIENGHVSKGKFLQQLNAFLLDTLGKGNIALLVVDEAQNLDLQLIEEIRMLMNLETSNEKLLQVILAGQPEFHNLLNIDVIRQFKQRISLRYHLRPLDSKETWEYIRRRLHIAGHNGNRLFTQEAIQGIYEYSGGLPRLINVVCDNALLTGYGLEKKNIDLQIVREVTDDLEGKRVFPKKVEAGTKSKSAKPVEKPQPENRTGPLLWALAGCLILIMGLLIMLLFYRYNL